MEAENFPVRGLGYLAGLVLALDLVVSVFVVTQLREHWDLWLFAVTLLAAIAAFAVVSWLFLALWQLARSRSEI